AWDRLCSADLARPTAFFDSDSRLGTTDRIFLDGEENNEGRAWARIITGSHKGEAWQLARFGRMSYENIVASPSAQRKTVVVLLDDANINTASTDPTTFPSELYIYIGQKQRAGQSIEKAGLTNGKLYGVKVSLKDGTLVTGESNEFGLGNAEKGYISSGKFTLVQLGDQGDVSNMSALDLETATIAGNIFRMQRVEDGAWDPRRRHEDDFYFLTTASFTSNSRLWRVHFKDIEHPEKGGTIEILLRGDEGHKMLDNMTIDRCGRVLMQEDPGNNPHIAKIWLYGIKRGELIEVAHHNPKFFDPTEPKPVTFFTQDEESSGIIDAKSILGMGWFLMDVQAHLASTDPELVQGGQLLTMYVDPRIECEMGKEDRDHGDDQDYGMELEKESE
ncbi:MAG: hypothetical protein L0Y56_06615, partial [Nitrospira sp.]|nr:hypothetical protein [Nitrospira sp.]